jgi:hypothetical protein
MKVDTSMTSTCCTLFNTKEEEKIGLMPRMTKYVPKFHVTSNTRCLDGTKTHFIGVTNILITIQETATCTFKHCSDCDFS